jgi:glycosyltransferase involved in cell wall biosynthesis
MKNNVNLKLLNISPAFYPATYWGGPIYSVYGLCNALAKLPNIKIKVLTTDSAGPALSESLVVTSIPVQFPEGYDVYYFRRWFGLSISPRLLLNLWTMIKWSDVVHLTAVYSFPTIPALLICRILGKPVVWSPRGALQRWERASKIHFKSVWELICNSLITPYRCVLHVTSEKEAADSKARIPNALTELISNGVYFPESLPARDWLPEGRLRLLYLGRLHPIKGIENLVQAVKLIENKEVSLTICGNGDEAYMRTLHKLVHDLKLDGRIEFQGHVDGTNKFSAFMQADICIVPSFSENFGMVVAEALAHGVPVVASKGTPWVDLENKGCGVWVDNSPSALAEGILRIREMDLETMGHNARQWMGSSYKWSAIGQQMYIVYERLLEKNK